MNIIESVNEDEDFPVFKAGPPLPIRTKPSSTKSLRERSRNCKEKNGPLQKVPSTSVSQLNSSNNVTTTKSSSTSVFKSESKVKKYIERVKASDELGRQKRIKPERMLSLEDLYQVNVDACLTKQTTDKTESPGESRSSENNSTRRHSLQCDKVTSVIEVQDKLRETLRIVKEKDELINKLRESCHDLAIKCADAENRVDELRFSYRRSTNIDNDDKQSRRESALFGDTKIGQHFTSLRKCASDEGLHRLRDCNNVANRKERSQRNHENSNNMQTEIDKEISMQLTSTFEDVVGQNDKQTQIEAGSLSCKDRNGGTSEQEVGQWREEDDILQETCSNWMEKVQNWKTDSNFNLSQDSGGDKDSGFRGSAEIEMDSIKRQHHHHSLPRSSSTSRRTKGHSHQHQKHTAAELEAGCSKTRFLKVPSSRFCLGSSANISIPVPKVSSSSTTTITATGTCKPPLQPSSKENDDVQRECSVLGQPETTETKQHFWPSFSSTQPYFNLNQYQSGDMLSSGGTKAKSLFYEMAEAERNKYVYFHHHHKNRLGGAKSLDVLYFPQRSPPNSEELRSLIDSSFDPPEFILKTHLDAQHRSMDKTVKLLDPLLDDTTEIAMRVKRKSERLAKMLQDAILLD